MIPYIYGETFSTSENEKQDRLLDSFLVFGGMKVSYKRLKKMEERRQNTVFSYFYDAFETQNDKSLDDYREDIKISEEKTFAYDYSDNVVGAPTGYL